MVSPNTDGAVIALQHRLGGQTPPQPKAADPAWPVPLASPALTGLAGDVVRALEPHSEADPAALLVNFLVMVGNAIGRGPFVQVGEVRHGVNLAAVHVGATSKGRKGTANAGPLRLVR